MIKKIKHGLLVLSGYLYLWILIGNLAGHTLIAIGDGAKETCYPYIEMWGVFAVECSDSWMTFAWFWTISIPRFIFMPLYTTLDLLMSGSAKWAMEGFAWFFLYALPITLLIILPGYLFWKRKNTIFAKVTLTLFILMIVMNVL